jgi:hypothetical protein
VAVQQAATPKGILFKNKNKYLKKKLIYPYKVSKIFNSPLKGKKK